MLQRISTSCKAFPLGSNAMAEKTSRSPAGAMAWLGMMIIRLSRCSTTSPMLTEASPSTTTDSAPTVSSLAGEGGEASGVASGEQPTAKAVAATTKAMAFKWRVLRFLSMFRYDSRVRGLRSHPSKNRHHPLLLQRIVFVQTIQEPFIRSAHSREQILAFLQWSTKLCHLLKQLGTLP